MSYPLEIRLASNNGFFRPSEAQSYYGKYARDGITVHWWNSPDRVTDADHDNITNYILGKAARGVGSVNYVLSNSKITLVVNPDNVAWASQGGNPTTVSVEFSPHLNAEGYKKAGWLINELFNTTDGRYKKAPKLYKHSDWYGTQCPGTLDLNRMYSEAKKWADGAYDAPKPVPVPPAPETPIINGWSLWKETEQMYVFNKDTYLYDLSNATSWGTIKEVKAFKKGDLVTIAGSFNNTKLNRTYYVTRYSFDKKIANGFSTVDLEVYVPPRPVPVPPEPPTAPPDVTEPELPETDDPISELPVDDMPNWFKKCLNQILEFLKGLVGKE